MRELRQPSQGGKIELSYLARIMGISVRELEDTEMAMRMRGLEPPRGSQRIGGVRTDLV